jgi:hypothetical protein
VQKKEKNEYADDYMDVGFSLYLIMARMVDTDPRMLDYREYTTLFLHLNSPYCELHYQKLVH